MASKMMKLNAQMRSMSVRPTATLRVAPSTASLSACSFRAGQQLRMATPVAPRECISTLVEAKNKLKTRKAAAKRYKITGSGKVMTRKPGKQHLNEKYSRSQKNAMSQESAISRSVVKRNVIGALPYAKINKAQNPKCMEREVNKKAAKVAPKWTAEESE